MIRILRRNKQSIEKSSKTIENHHHQKSMIKSTSKQCQNIFIFKSIYREKNSEHKHPHTHARTHACINIHFQSPTHAPIKSTIWFFGFVYSAYNKSNTGDVMFVFLRFSSLHWFVWFSRTRFSFAAAAATVAQLNAFITFVSMMKSPFNLLLLLYSIHSLTRSLAHNNFPVFFYFRFRSLSYLSLFVLFLFLNFYFLL